MKWGPPALKLTPVSTATTAPIRAETRRRQRQALIIAAAEDQLGESGIAGTTLDRVGERVGLSKGALYYYVDGRADLFALVLDDVLREIRLEAVEKTGADPDPLRRLECFARAHVHAAVERPAGQLIVSNIDLLAAHERSAELLHRHEAEARELVKLAVEGGQLRAEASQIGIIMANEAGVITGCTDAADTMFGYEPAELIGANLKVLMPEEASKKHESQVQRYVDTREPRVLGQARQVEGRRKDGSIFPLSLTCTELVTGGVSHFIAAAEDLTGQLDARTERHSAQVAKQAALIARQAALAAENANRAKISFMSRIGHELRGPLTAIMGFAQLSEMEAQTGEQLENAAIISAAGRSLLDLINDVLDAAMIESGEIELSIEDVSIMGVVLECVSVVNADPGPGINLIDPATETGFVCADRLRLRQVVLNLISAVTESDIEGDEVSIEITSPIENRTRVSVINESAGVDLEALAKIVNSSASRPFEGTNSGNMGLGLSVSAALTRAMGGSIGVQAARGGGPIIWIDLPGSDSLKSRSDPSPVSASTEISTDVTGTVLYIEDNAANVRLIERILRRRPSVALLLAEDGTLGLELAVSHLPDMILLDLHLPGISGRDVLRSLKSVPATKDIPVLVLSADADPANAQLLKEAGAWQFLPKPIDVRQVLSVVDEVIAERNPD